MLWCAETGSDRNIYFFALNCNIKSDIPYHHLYKVFVQMVIGNVPSSLARPHTAFAEIVPHLVNSPALQLFVKIFR